MKYNFSGYRILSWDFIFSFHIFECDFPLPSELHYFTQSWLLNILFFFSVYCYFSFEAFRIFSCLAFNNSTMVYLGINVLVFILSRLNWAGWIHMSMLFLGAFFSHYFFKYLYVLFSLFFFCDFHYIYITILNQVLFLRVSEAVCVCVCVIHICFCCCLFFRLDNFYWSVFRFIDIFLVLSWMCYWVSLQNFSFQ